MAKFLTTIMVLLYLCFSVQANRDICFEMMKGLKTLNTLYKQNKTNVSFPTTMTVPSTEMQNNSNKCVGVFVKELKSILSNVTVHNDDRNVITGIQTVLQQMEDQQPTANGQQVGQTCLMNPLANSLKPFQQFINFLRHLSKKRH